MNQNYQTLPKLRQQMTTATEFNDFFKKYFKFQFFIITNDKTTFNGAVDFYFDETNNKIYFELPTLSFQKLSNVSSFQNRIKTISQNYYQILPQLSTTMESNTSSNALIDELKSKLEKINPQLLPQIRAFSHKKKDIKKINFIIDDLMIYTPASLKDAVVALLKSLQPNQEQVVSNQNANIRNDDTKSPKIETIASFPVFQKNYQDSQKNFIKEVLKEIPIDKLVNLKLYELDPNKKDKFDKPIKTNFKNLKKKPILYYQKNDLPTIKKFLKQTKQGFSVRFCRCDQKQIHFNNIILALSNKNKITQNYIDYYITLDGKKYYYLVLIDNNNPKNNKKIIINHLDDLTKSQKEQIQKTYQKLKNETNIENLFNKLYDLFGSVVQR